MAAKGFINFARSGVTAEQISQSGWRNIQPTADVAIEFNDVSDNQPNGVFVTFVNSTGGFPGTLGSELAGIGNASWAPIGSLRGGIGSPSGFAIIRYSGLDNSKLYTLRYTGSVDIVGRGIQFEYDGVGKFLDCYDEIATEPNRTDAVIFEDVTPVFGVIDVKWVKEGATGYLSVLGIEEQVLPPAVTTTDTLQPGEDFTLTATNYASAPVSPVTLTDSQGSTITVPVTISGSGPYTATGTMPTLAEAVTAGTSLLFGDVTIELST